MEAQREVVRGMEHQLLRHLRLREMDEGDYPAAAAVGLDEAAIAGRRRREQYEQQRLEKVNGWWGGPRTLGLERPASAPLADARYKKLAANRAVMFQAGPSKITPDPWVGAKQFSRPPSQQPNPLRSSAAR